MSVENGQKIAGRLVGATMDWLDMDAAKNTVNECLKFAKKTIETLNLANLDEVKPKDLSQMIAYTVKALDEAARLVQFGQGQPDSRAEVTIGQLLPLLTQDELAIFDAAMERLSGFGDQQLLPPH